MPPPGSEPEPPSFQDTLPPAEDGSSHIRVLAEQGTQRHYRRGAIIIQEGERGDTLYIVRSGRLRAFVSDAAGKELTLGVYGPGEYVGEMSLDGGPRSASVEATEDTVCAVVTRSALLAYIARYPDLVGNTGRASRREWRAGAGRTHHPPADRPPPGLFARDGQPLAERPGNRRLPGRARTPHGAAQTPACALVIE